jgi:molybdopterin-biosynthesis enzyme MoeA-like protein
MSPSWRVRSERVALAAAHDWVVTSGGVGPTHDDVTLEGVARAFGRELERDPLMTSRIEGHYGDKTTDDHLRMADVPRGSIQRVSDEIPWPVTQIENVFVLPGVPKIFAWKLPLVLAQIPRGASILSRAIYARADEGEVAAMLRQIELEERVQVGSYPIFGDSEVSVKFTFDGVDPDALERAVQRCLGGLPEGALVRID